jgi:RNA-directed DNA polymerase
MCVADPDGSGRIPREYGPGASSVTARTESDYPETLYLMEAVIERENMKAAYRRVKANKGAGGVDGMSVQDLQAHLVEHWPHIKEDLLRFFDTMGLVSLLGLVKQLQCNP